MVDDGDVDAAVCILETEDINSVVSRSRKPMKDFHSPFLGKTDDEIRSWVKKHLTGSKVFAKRTFTILDKDTVKNKTCRIGYVGGDDRMVLAEFIATLCIRVPIEVSVRSWDEQPYVGEEKVHDRMFYEV